MWKVPAALPDRCWWGVCRVAEGKDLGLAVRGLVSNSISVFNMLGELYLG